VGTVVAVTSEGAGSIVWPEGRDVGELTRDNANGVDVVLTVG
jgi:hypothetical protein